MKIKYRNIPNLLNSYLHPAEELDNIIISDTMQASQNVHYQELAPYLLNAKRSEILSKISNDPGTEKEFRKIYSLCDASASSPELNEVYHEYFEAYYKIASLYIMDEVDNRTNLIIYDTENEIEDAKVLKTPEVLDSTACIAKLPNGELFCFGKCYLISGITLIIEKNYSVRVLPSGEKCYWSSAIYYNRSIYCFGGVNRQKDLALSMRFDLDCNRWVRLAPMPQADYLCRNAIFNDNILISGWKSANLLLYSVEIDSFSRIPYDFAENKFKIVINAERLFLIECGGSGGMVFESEIGDEYNWKKIAKSIVNCDVWQVNYSYNKGGIYIIALPEKR